MHGPHTDARSPVGDGRHGSLFLEEGDGTLDFADLVGAMDAVVDEGDDDELQLPLQLPVSPRGNGDHDVESSSFVVALFCDGFVCRHWTHKSGWVEGFAQSYDATSRSTANSEPFSLHVSKQSRLRVLCTGTFWIALRRNGCPTDCSSW
jgi:hypothetical protein